MKYPPVRAKRLHEHALRLGSRPSETGSVFPFFDREGAVSFLMVALPHTSEVYAVRWRTRLVTIPPVGAVRIGGGTFALDPLDEQSARQLAALWHYDPWWILTEPRYRDYWAAPMLKETNVIPHLQEHNVTSVCFTRDLSRAYTATIGMKDDASIRRWKPSWLPESGPQATEETPPRVERRGMWRLDPIWDRRCRDARTRS